jgi:hypothetical protein
VLREIDIPSLPFIATYGVTVRSLDAVEALLRAGDIGTRRTGEVLIAPFPGELGNGAWLFSEHNQSCVFD